MKKAYEVTMETHKAGKATVTQAWKSKVRLISFFSFHIGTRVNARIGRSIALDRSAVALGSADEARPLEIEVGYMLSKRLDLVDVVACHVGVQGVDTSTIPSRVAKDITTVTPCSVGRSLPLFHWPRST